MKFFAFFLIYFLFNFINASEIKFENLSANFTQQITSGKSKLNYSGNFIIDENRAFWSYKKPIKKSVYFDGEIFTQIEPDLEQAIITKIQNAPNLSQIFNISKEISKGYYEAKYDDILYKIWTKNSLPVKISYEDKLSNLVEISLSNIKKDQNLKSEIFTPKIPAEFDIIQN